MTPRESRRTCSRIERSRGIVGGNLGAIDARLQAATVSDGAMLENAIFKDARVGIDERGPHTAVRLKPTAHFAIVA